MNRTVLCFLDNVLFNLTFKSMWRFSLVKVKKSLSSFAVPIVSSEYLLNDLFIFSRISLYLILGSCLSVPPLLLPTISFAMMSSINGVNSLFLKSKIPYFVFLTCKSLPVAAINVTTASIIERITRTLNIAVTDFFNALREISVICAPYS